MLNTHVRPFTAKWHRASQHGALTALDATDEFRAELTALQALLRHFDNFLLKVYDDEIPALPADLHDDRADRIEAEMGREMRYGISESCRRESQTPDKKRFIRQF